MYLEQFFVHWQDGDPLNPSMVHAVCGEAVCDIEEGDTFSVLAATAKEHLDYGCPGPGKD